VQFLQYRKFHAYITKMNLLTLVRAVDFCCEHHGEHEWAVGRMQSFRMLKLEILLAVSEL
jgi:hypothetical protein